VTEITANIEPREPIKPVAFVAALILAPIVFTAPFFAMFLVSEALGDKAALLAVVSVIPMVALSFGALPYLVFGTPTFIIALRRGLGLGGAGFLANVMAATPIFLGMSFTEGFGGAAAFSIFMLLFGSIFAPAWGATFGWLYSKLASL